MEKTSINTTLSLSFLPYFLELILLIHRILNWVLGCQKLCYKFLSPFLAKSGSTVCEGKGPAGCENNDKLKSRCMHRKEGETISRQELEIVMESLGIYCCPNGGEKLRDCFDFYEMGALFEEKEPSLEELKEAFCVFDENRDGFVDAKELHGVLCKLGFKEGYWRVDECEEMIRASNQNRDGRIDFNEFVKLMESSFC